jgi:hypothetical protein
LAPFKLGAPTSLGSSPAPHNIHTQTHQTPHADQAEANDWWQC